MTGPYTPKPMQAASGATDARDSRFEGLHAEASAAVGYSANTIRRVREGYRRAYADALSRWQDLRDELDGIDSPDATWDRALDAQRRSLRSDRGRGSPAFTLSSWSRSSCQCVRASAYASR